jgi:hypothetical protein
MRTRTLRNLLQVSAAVTCWSLASYGWAVDIESFDFNDATGTQLGAAANTANPGNSWFVDADMAPSQVAQNVDSRPGSYYILKSNSASDNNYLQIDNIASGKRYLTTKIAGWDFEEAPETFRLGFVDGDTEPDFSITITAQMSLVRSGDMVELTGGALGPNSSPISSEVFFPAVHLGNFEMTLELDKTANTYKVFYRDENGPTQVLGAGLVDPPRGGNAVRMQAVGNYSEFITSFPGTYNEDYVSFFAVDRVALADTNPHTDLITLEVDRDNGAMKLRNTSGAAINGIESYSIVSESGGLNPANWTPIGGGTNTSSNESLMQTFAAAINLTNGQEVSLSNASGAWLKSPFEDLQMVLNLTGGDSRTVNVNFIDNGGLRFMPGDFNFDNAITAADYQFLALHGEEDLMGMSVAEAYRLGDLNEDIANDIFDFVDFKALYDSVNGAGSFDLMLSTVPESSTFLLAITGVLSLLGLRRNRCPRTTRTAPAYVVVNSHGRIGEATMPRRTSFLGSACCVFLTLVFCTANAKATILEDFQFNEPDDTSLEDTENSANPSNLWTVDTTDTVDSFVLDGKFRIQKQATTALASNYIDIDNITNSKAWLVAEIAGWNFTATAAGEDVRFAFLDNDSDPPTGSTIAAQMRILRSATALELEGTALGTGAQNLGSTYALPLMQTDPFTMVLELDKTTDRYSVYYKDGADPFAILGTQVLGAKIGNSDIREGNSVRFGFTGAFGDVGEFFDIDRIYLTDTNPITDVVDPVTLSLIVNTTTRDVFIKNETDDPIRFDSYRIASETESLSFGEWASLADRNPALTPFDGPDGGTTAGDSPGELWTKSGGSDDGALAESFLLSDTTLSPDDELLLGKIFKVGGNQDLVFQYHDADTGSLFTLDATYVTSMPVAGDYNNDGTVNAADYTIWRDHLNQSFQLENEGGISPGVVDQDDYDFWKSQFGATSGSGSAGVSAVPEPASFGLALGVLIAAFVARRR